MGKNKENVQHVENQFIFEAGSNNTIIKDSTFNAPVYTCKLEEEDNEGNEEDAKQIPCNVIEALDQVVRDKIDAGEKPKQILLPVRAALEVPIALPFSNVAGFNERYDCNISSSTWSRCIKSIGCEYDSREFWFIRHFE